MEQSETKPNDESEYKGGKFDFALLQKDPARLPGIEPYDTGNPGFLRGLLTAGLTDAASIIGMVRACTPEIGAVVFVATEMAKQRAQYWTENDPVCVCYRNRRRTLEQRAKTDDSVRGEIDVLKGLEQERYAANFHAVLANDFGEPGIAELTRHPAEYNALLQKAAPIFEQEELEFEAS
ncbi:hypothetical protein EON81_03000 [bacterium]|nr:MAG: hypothetical protein EON81_03000 [bacterium]